uniref:Transcription factor CP2-like 1 n=1 Tax=Poecilia formosa TaxID=48698 RepID=A0A096M6S9_POEFO
MARYVSAELQSGRVSSALSSRDALAPFLKTEEARLRADSGARRPPFHYVLCAATSPAVKQQDETLTYLNQGQSYEIRMLNRKLVEYSDISSRYVKSIVRIVFHDRRLQYMEHQHLEGWRWNRPGDRILDIDVPLSVGILDPRSDPLHLNTIEFLWDPLKNASVFIQVHCISTEFTPRKHGGEKGVPFCLQVDSFTSNDQGEYVEHVHSSNCQVKVFKPKGADRKLKTDREKMEKKTPQDRDKYQLSHETTLLKECSQWPESLNLSSSSTPSPVCLNSPCGFTDGSVQPRLTLYVCQQQQSGGPAAMTPGGSDDMFIEDRDLIKEKLELLNLLEKIAGLYSIAPQQITHIYRQKTTGIHVLVSDQMVQNLGEEASFLISTIRDETSDGYHVVMK